MAANLVLPYTHTAAQPQDASQFMANLRAIQTWILANAQLLDGTVLMSGLLTGPASDPSTTAQYMRKSYVDAFITALAASRVPADLATPRHGFEVGRFSVQTATTTPTNITWLTESYDTDSFFPGAGNTTATIPSGMDGTYCLSLIVASNNANPSSSINPIGTIYINGVALATASIYNNFLSTNIAAGSTCVLTNLSVGDTVVVKLYTPASTCDVTLRLTVQRLGAA